MEDMTRLSETVATTFDGLTHDLETFSLSAAITLGDARAPITQEQTPERLAVVNAYLQHLFESHGLLRAIFVTDTDGRVVYDNDSNSFGLDLSDRPYIQALQAGATEYWSDGFPGSQTGAMVVAHSRAIVDPEGVTTGYLIVAVRTEALASRLPEGLADKGHISVIDGTGKLILRIPEDPRVPLGTDVSEWSGLEAARTKGGLTVQNQAISFAPQDQYGAFIPMSKLGWVVGVTLPSGEVEGATTGLFLRDIVGLGAIILVGFAAMWVFASQTVKPLSRLTEVAGSISRGDAPQNPALVNTGNAEVSLLADSMAQMYQAIRDREEQLRLRNQTIEAIERFGESLASELNLEKAVHAIVDAGAELVAADAVQFFYRGADLDDRYTAVAGPNPSLALAKDASIVRDILTGDAAQNSKAISLKDTNGDAPTAGSLLGIPVRERGGEIQGAIILLKAEAGSFTDYHRWLVEGLARWASIVLENASLYAQSQALVEELAQSNQAKNEFLGIVSHELRTPITTIYGGTLLLRLRRDSLPKEAFDDMIVSVSEEAERLHHLVQDLLMIARSEAELTVEPRLVSVPDVLQTSIADFSAIRNRPITVAIEPGLPPAFADTTFLRQVVNNLLSNADKYSPSGEPVNIEVGMEDGHIAVRVEDNGPGVAEPDLSQIFDSFYRSRDAVDKASGSGLGLTVCKRLIEALGGGIWAVNRAQGGLEVGFTLKIAAHLELEHAASDITSSTPAASNGVKVIPDGESASPGITQSDSLATTAEPTD